MPQTYKILGQAFVTPNTLTNVYVTGTSTSAVVNSIYVCNADVNPANVQIILRPINETLENKHTIIRDEVVDAASTHVINLGITLGQNIIIAANSQFTSLPGTLNSANLSVGAFGLEIT